MSSFFISIDVISGTLGPLIFAVNVRLPYFISLGAAFLVVFIQLGLREILPTRKQVERVLSENFQQMVTGFRLAFKNKVFVWLTLFSILIFTTGKVFAEMVSTPFLINYVGYSLKNLSVIGFIASLMQASFVFFADKFENKLGDRWSFLLTILIFPFAAVLFAFSRNIGLTAVLLGVYYSTWSFSEVIVESYISHNVSDSKRATILSISSMFISFFALLSLPVLGSVVDKISLQNSLILLAAEFVVLGLILFSQYQGKNNQNKLNSV